MAQTTKSGRVTFTESSTLSSRGTDLGLSRQRNRKRDETCTILIRVEESSLAARGRPPVVQKQLAEKLEPLGLGYSDITDIHTTATGWYLEALTEEIRDTLLAPEGQQILKGTLHASKIERPETWYTYVCTNIPYSFPNYVDGGTLETKDIISDEVYTKKRVQPCSIRPSRHGPDPATGRGTWLISFLEPVSSFSLFHESNRSILKRKKDPEPQLHNPGCLGYCNPKKCRRAWRCESCTQLLSSHAEGPCTSRSKCMNCKGPHLSGHRGCPVAPKKNDGEWCQPPPKQRKEIAKRSEQIYREVLQKELREAEEKKAEARTESMARDLADFERSAYDKDLADRVLGTPGAYEDNPMTVTDSTQGTETSGAGMDLDMLLTPGVPESTPLLTAPQEAPQSKPTTKLPPTRTNITRVAKGKRKEPAGDPRPRNATLVSRRKAAETETSRDTVTKAVRSQDTAAGDMEDQEMRDTRGPDQDNIELASPLNLQTAARCALEEDLEMRELYERYIRENALRENFENEEHTL